jgi:hypothetical protein
LGCHGSTKKSSNLATLLEENRGCANCFSAGTNNL